MNLGERKTQISSDAVPAIRTSPMRCGLQRFGDDLQPDAAAAAELVPRLLRPGDVVLVKGSLAVGLEAVCRALTAPRSPAVNGAGGGGARVGGHR